MRTQHSLKQINEYKAKEARLKKRPWIIRHTTILCKTKNDKKNLKYDTVAWIMSYGFLSKSKSYFNIVFIICIKENDIQVNCDIPKTSLYSEWNFCESLF